MEQTASEHEATIEAQAEILTETAHALASIEQTVNQYGAEIISQAELIGLNTKSISSVSERVTATEAELSGVAEWRENMDMANSNIIRNSRGEFNLTSNVLVISSTEFAIVNGKIESDALTVTTDENTIHVVSDAINMWGDGEYLVTPRTQRVKASTEYTVSFEFCPSTDSVGVNVVAFRHNRRPKRRSRICKIYECGCFKRSCTERMATYHIRSLHLQMIIRAI